jgi:hypothetical protein
MRPPGDATELFGGPPPEDLGVVDYSIEDRRGVLTFERPDGKTVRCGFRASHGVVTGLLESPDPN